MILHLDERRELRRAREAERQARQHLLEMLQARWSGSQMASIASTSACIFLEHPERIPGTCFCTIRKDPT